MNTVKWGMIGCGSVTENKSGPAFSKVLHSELVAVSSRNYIKAKDYCLRHQVPMCVEQPEALISNSNIDAVYIATPPDVHAYYSIMALEAGKAVYVEKPMALNYTDCIEMLKSARNSGNKLFVAYYRRALEYFRFIASMLEMRIIGKILNFSIELILPPRPDDYNENKPWRVKPEISGGGYFFDLASHQYDLIFYLLGNIVEIKANAFNSGKLYSAEDSVDAIITLDNETEGIGRWRFAESSEPKKDTFTIQGTDGSIVFSTFSGSPIIINRKGKISTHQIAFPKHIQMPMIQSVVNEILNIEKSFSNEEVAAEVNKWLFETVKNYYC